MMKNTNTRGFTLIELLVVIAIIGILASVVLASLNSARDKGSSAAIKSSLNNMRAQAELIYDTAGGSYATICTDPKVVAAGAAVTSAGGTWLCSADSNEWTAQSTLVPSATAGFYCADYKGNATSTAASVSNVTPGGDGDRDCD